MAQAQLQPPKSHSQQQGYVEKEVRFTLPEDSDEEGEGEGGGEGGDQGLCFFPYEFEEITKALTLVIREKEKNEPLYFSLVNAITMQKQLLLQQQKEQFASSSSDNPKQLRLQRKKQLLSEDQLLSIVKGLSLFCSDLDHKVHELISAILKINWLEKSPAFISCYVHLLQNLVSAQASYITPITSMLIKNFSNGPQTYSTIPPNTVFDLTHSTLIKILRLIPLGPSFLMPILSQHLPHKSEPLEVQTFYVRCLLNMSKYVPVLKNQLLGLILDLMVQIDIDIQVEDLEEEELLGGIDDDDEDQDHEGLFEMEMEAKETFTVISDEDSETESDNDDQLCIAIDSKSMITKLDAVMCLMLENINALFKQCDNTKNYVGFIGLFQGLLEGFDRVMLPTHKLRSSQFIIFYACSLLPDSLPEDYLGFLVDHAFSVSNSAITRMASASYLGSFIARAKYLQLSSIRQCLYLLNHECQQFVDANESSIKGQIEVDRYGVLYASVQSILYIFCFRWKQLMLVNEKPTSGAFPSELTGFQRILLSKFNPLRVCSEAIVKEFAKISHHLNIMYCYPLIQSSSTKENTSMEASNTPLPKSQELSVLKRLETFFPFDPLALPMAKQYMSQIFQEWDGGGDESETTEDPSDSDLGNSLKGMSLDERNLSFSMSMSISH